METSSLKDNFINVRFRIVSNDVIPNLNFMVQYQLTSKIMPTINVIVGI